MSETSSGRLRTFDAVPSDTPARLATMGRLARMTGFALSRPSVLELFRRPGGMGNTMAPGPTALGGDATRPVLAARPRPGHRHGRDQRHKMQAHREQRDVSARPEECSAR